ncbi:MAG: tetratricopeptide repeat protein [Magnetococcales bacterium]|nr:tetratricopeptide repeat protein [Magnetococcales bacterium]
MAIDRFESATQQNELFEEVNHQVEVEQWRQLWQRHRVALITALVLLVAGLMALAWWQEQRQQQNRSAAAIFLAAQVAFDAGRWSEVFERSAQMQQNFSRHDYNLLIRFLEARAMVAANRSEEALQRLQTLATDAGEASPLAAMAWLNAAWLSVDGDVVRARSFLARISTQSPFSVQAGELEGVLLEKEGQFAAAAQRYRQVLQQEVPSSLRTRLQRRLERMGEGGETP